MHAISAKSNTPSTSAIAVEFRASESEIGRLLAALDAEAGGVAISRRRSPRHPLRGLRVIIEVERPHCPTTRIMARVRNISRHGLSILSCVLLQPGTEFQIFLPINPDQSPIAKCAVVRRTRHLQGTIHEIGAEFGHATAPSPDDEQLLDATRYSKRDLISHRPEMNRAYTMERVRKEVELRAISPVVQQILSLTASSRTALDEVSNTVMKDPTLAASVLRSATSAMYDNGRAAKSVNEAVHRLGMDGVRNCACHILMSEQFADADAAGLIPRRNWEHALGTAIIAQLFARQVSSADPDTCYLAGLLHGIGRIAMASLFEAEYREVLSAVRQIPDIAAAERQALGVSSQEITRVVLEEMKMAPDVVDAASLAGDAIRTSRRDAKATVDAVIVAAANRLAYAALLGGDSHDLLLPLSPPMATLGLAEHLLPQILADARDAFGESAIYYAMKSDAANFQSRADELREMSSISPRILWVGTATDESPPIFLDALGWLDQGEPTALAAWISTKTRAKPLLNELRSLKDKFGCLPLLLFRSRGFHGSMTEFEGHEATFVDIPQTHTAIAEQISTTLSRHSND